MRLPIRIKRSPTAKRLAGGAFWTTLNNGLNRVLFLLTSILLARVLGRLSFGVFSMGRSTLGLFQLLSGFGLSITGTKYVGEFRNQNPARAGKIISSLLLAGASTGFIGGFILFFLSHYISIHILNNPDLNPLLQIGSLILVVGTVPGVINGILLGLESFSILALVGILSSIFLLAFPVLGAYLFGLMGSFLGLLLASCMTFLIVFPIFFKQLKKSGITLSLDGLTNETSILWKFSFPALLSGGILIIATWIINALLAQVRGGYTELAALAAGVSWRGPLIFFPTVFGNSFFPILSNFLGNREYRRYRKTLFVQVIFTAGTTVLGAMVVILFSPFLMGLFGKTFRGSTVVLYWLALSAIPMSVTMTFDRVFQSMGRMWLGLTTSLGWAGVLIGCTLFFLGKGRGAEGVAEAFLIAYSCHMVWQGVLVFFLVKGLGKKAEGGA